MYLNIFRQIIYKLIYHNFIKNILIGQLKSQYLELFSFETSELLDFKDKNVYKYVNICKIKININLLLPSLPE